LRTPREPPLSHSLVETLSGADLHHTRSAPLLMHATSPTGQGECQWWVPSWKVPDNERERHSPMVNYYANARSNYFRVKDLTAFTREADRLGLEILSGDGNGLVMVTPRLADFDDGAWPSEVWDEDTGEAENFDIAQWVSGHLE